MEPSYSNPLSEIITATSGNWIFDWGFQQGERTEFMQVKDKTEVVNSLSEIGKIHLEYQCMSCEYPGIVQCMKLFDTTGSLVYQGPDEECGDEPAPDNETQEIELAEGERIIAVKGYTGWTWNKGVKKVEGYWIDLQFLIAPWSPRDTI